MMKMWMVPAVGDRRTRVINDEVQYRATKAHLEQFDAATANLEAESISRGRTKFAQLAIDAVRAQAVDLRAEIEEYERLRSRHAASFEA